MSPIVLYMDNASIHSDEALQQLCAQTGHILIMGPEYTPEMNPIELLFGFWKGRTRTLLGAGLHLDRDVYMRAIQEAFQTITEDQIRASVNHVFYEVYPKVYRREDI